MSYNHQDWNTVILKPKKEVAGGDAAAKTARPGFAIAAGGKPAYKIEQQVDGDSGKPLNYVSKEDAQKVVAGRVAMKLSQKDLAMRLNMQVKDIQDIESGRAIENKQVLGKIKRLLGI